MPYRIQVKTGTASVEEIDRDLSASFEFFNDEVRFDDFVAMLDAVIAVEAKLLSTGLRVVERTTKTTSGTLVVAKSQWTPGETPEIAYEMAWGRA